MKTNLIPSDKCDKILSDIYQLLCELSNFDSPSGNETEFGEYIISEFSKYAFKSEIDTRGNVYFYKNASNPECAQTLMIMAHMDTIGVIVTHIEDNGYLRIDKIGGIDSTILAGRKIRFYANGKTLYGIVGAIPPHVKKNDKTLYEITDLWVDIGANNKEDAMKTISVGDYGTIQSEPTNMLHNFVSTGKLDNKVGLCIMLLLLKYFGKINIKNINIIFVASVQEEIGKRGASAICHSASPDTIIVLDVTHSSDYYGVNKAIYGNVKAGEGPVFPISPDTTSEIQSTFKEIAYANNLKYQIQAFSRPVGTDTDPLQKHNANSKIGLLCIPCRYMHSPYEVCSVTDIDTAIKILKNYIIKQDAVTPFKPD